MKHFNGVVLATFSLLAISFISVYFMPSVITRILFLIILLIAWRTKYDYVYLVWFIIINDAPGRLFGAGGGGEAMRIPLYTLAAGFSLSFQDLFIIMFVIKYLTNKQITTFFLNKEFKIFFTVLAFYVAYSFLFGVGYKEFVLISRMLIPWFFILIIPAYIPNRVTMSDVSRMLFPVVFIAFVSQVYTYITGTYWDYQLRGEDLSLQLMVDNSSAASRSYSSVYIIFICTIQAFYYLLDDKQNMFSKKYLSLIIVISIFSIYLTATRGWIIAYGVLLVGILIVYGTSRDISRLFKLGLAAVAIILILTTQLPVLRSQMDLVYERFTTLEILLKGDVTAGGTLARLDERGPRVMGKFKENPILGWGFSEKFFEYADGHVGHQTILLNTGLIGYIYLNILFIHILSKIIKIKSTTELDNVRSIWVYIFAMLSVYAIHSSSTIFWGFSIGTVQIMTIAIILTAVNTMVISDYKASNE
jgi:hypothetical protein